MNEYILNINRLSQWYRFKLQYKNGNFHRLERLSGFLPYKQHINLMLLVPQTEDLIKELAEKYTNRGIVYEKVEKKKTTHQLFIEKYCAWYYRRFQIETIIKPQDVQAIKGIRQGLIKLSGSEAEALLIWETLLNDWDKQEEWYISQTELPQIKRNINVILKTLKHGKSTQQAGKKATDVSANYRKSI